MNTNSIKWPQNDKEAIFHFLNFQLMILREFELNFSNYPSDPIKIVEDYLNENIEQERYENSAGEWWDYLDKNEKSRDFQSNEALMTRLALCLLSVKREDVLKLNEHVSWFLEVLGFMGLDMKKVLKMYIEYFSD